MMQVQFVRSGVLVTRSVFIWRQAALSRNDQIYCTAVCSASVRRGQHNNQATVYQGTLDATYFERFAQFLSAVGVYFCVIRISNKTASIKFNGRKNCWKRFFLSVFS